MDTVQNLLLVLGWADMEWLILFLQLRGAKKEQEHLTMVKMGLEPPLAFTRKVKDIWICTTCTASFKVSWWQARVFSSAMIRCSFAIFRLVFPLDNLKTVLCCPGLWSPAKAHFKLGEIQLPFGSQRTVGILTVPTPSHAQRYHPEQSLLQMFLDVEKATDS